MTTVMGCSPPDWNIQDIASGSNNRCGLDVTGAQRSQYLRSIPRGRMEPSRKAHKFCKAFVKMSKHLDKMTVEPKACLGSRSYPV